MKRSTALVAGVLLSVAGISAGQVAPTQWGNKLDRNYRVGGGGSNSIRRADPGINGNLYITGQVTGGFEFRGRSPYAGANQLRLDVPSAGLDSFLRGSAGLDRVMQGGTYGPGAYLSPQRTVLGVGSIAGGLTAPGTSMPRSAYVPSGQMQQLVDATVRRYRPIMEDLGTQLRVNALIQPMVEGTPASRLALLRAADRGQSGAIRPAASTLFGIVRAEDAERTGAEGAPSGQARRDDRVGEPIDARLEGRAQGTDAVTGREPPDERPAPEPAGATAQGLPDQGQDIFLDLLRTLKKVHQEPTLPEPAEPEKGKTPEPPAGEEQPDEATSPAPAPRRTAPAPLPADALTLRTLAGKSRDLFNLRMGRAEKLLSEGKFYEAAGSYEVATLFNPSNPLAPLGAALSRFAAGETLMASFHLRRAMKRFPPLMETRVDAKGMLGDNVVAKRIVQVEALIREQGDSADAPVLFLAAFVRAASGQPTKAAGHARKLKELAPEDKLYQAYANYLLTGKMPSGATTRPATTAAGPPAKAS